jgi:hypothetical protein
VLGEPEARAGGSGDIAMTSPDPSMFASTHAGESGNAEDQTMPFVQTPPDHRFTWYVRLFFWNQRRRYGAVLEPARLWGRSPKVFAALALFYGALDRRSSPLFAALRRSSPPYARW